jgi:hypothetical protein
MSTAMPASPAARELQAAFKQLGEALDTCQDVMKRLILHGHNKYIIFLVAAGCTVAFALLAVLLLAVVRVPAREFTLVVCAIGSLTPWVTYALYDMMGMRKIEKVMGVI